MDQTLNTDVVVNSVGYPAGTIPPKHVQNALKHANVWMGPTPPVKPPETILDVSETVPVVSQPEDWTAKALSDLLGGLHPKSEARSRAKLFQRAVNAGLILDGRNVD